jgi:hypothetical protein
MDAASDIFCMVSQEEFSFLISDFSFKAVPALNEHWSQVDFVSERVTIHTSWDYRDGVHVGIVVNVDTFWIRPASSHSFDMNRFLRLVDPSALDTIPKARVSPKSRENLQPILAFYAKNLRLHGKPILKGNLSLCEDVFITEYCNTAKGIPRDEYHKIFREECATLPAVDQQRLELAIASGSYLEIWFLVLEFSRARKVQSERFLTTANDFWLQYCR